MHTSYSVVSLWESPSKVRGFRSKQKIVSHYSAIKRKIKSILSETSIDWHITRYRFVAAFSAPSPFTHFWAYLLPVLQLRHLYTLWPGKKIMKSIKGTGNSFQHFSNTYTLTNECHCCLLTDVKYWLILLVLVNWYHTILSSGFRATLNCDG